MRTLVVITFQTLPVVMENESSGLSHFFIFLSTTTYGTSGAQSELTTLQVKFTSKAHRRLPKAAAATVLLA